MKAIRVLIFSVIAVILSMSCAGAAEMDAYNQKDTALNSGYTVRDLYTGCSQAFGYEVPEDGVTVLMFYGGQCSKSTQTLKMFAESRWMDHDYVNFYAVESSGTAQATVQHQMEVAAGKNASKFHPVQGSNSLLFDYVHQVYPRLGTISYPFVLLITKVGDTPYIRYASQDLQTLDFYSDAIEVLLAEHFETAGNLVYRIDDGTATVVGYTGTPTELTVPTYVEGVPVTAIDYGALQGCQSLTYVSTFPITATIGPYAFADCPNLYRVDLGCSGSLPEGIFSGCTNLAACQIEAGIFSIGAGAFDGCTQLQAVLGWNQLQNLAIIKENAFRGCKLLNLSIPSTVQLLGNQAFAGSGLTSATLPAGLRSLGTGVFQNCTSLSAAAVKNSLTALPQDTFSGCTALQSVSLPGGMTSIGREAFKNCSALSSISLPEALTSLEREAFAGSGLTAVTVPDTVASIGYAAFRDCSKLTSAALPKALTQLPESLFSYCSALTTVELPAGLTELPPTFFELCTALTTIQIPEGVTTIGNSAFSYCRSLSSITLPDGLKTIGGYAFAHCSTLSTIVLPAGLTSMEEHCFSGCDDLSAAYFRGNAPSEFGRNVFDDCRYNFTIHYTGGTRGWTDSSAYDSTASTWNGYPLALWETLFSGSCGAEGDHVIWTLDTNSGVLTLSGSGATKDLPWTYDPDRRERAYTPEWSRWRTFVQTVVIGEGITRIGTGTFYDHPFLTSVTVSGSVTEIGESAFSNCSALSSAGFCGNAPDVLGSFAFRNCAHDLSLLCPDGAAGWTFPLWNGIPITHTVTNDTELTHSALVPAGTRAILATFGGSGQMLDCTTVVWGPSPLVTLPLPTRRGAVSMQLFYLNSASAPFRAGNDLTDFVL